MVTSKNLTGQNTGEQLMFFQEDSPVNKQALTRLYRETKLDFQEKTLDSGLKCSVSHQKYFLALSLLKMLPVSFDGRVSFRRAWRVLATQFPSWKERLVITGYLIAENAISLLPTVTARDFRSPGKQSHPRLNGSRGLPLPEDLGSQLHPELSEALMGFPIGWTELEVSEMPSSRKSRTKSLKP